MAWGISLRQPFTSANVTPSDIALTEATTVRNFAGDSIEANISLSTFGITLLRRLLQFNRDGVLKFSGVIVEAPDASLVDEISTINVTGSRKRLYETLLDVAFVSGGDVGTMVNSVLSAGFLPTGYSYIASETFGFALGDRITRKSESIGDFLDAMAQALPAFTVPFSLTAEFIETYPEYVNYAAGEYVPAATWGVDAQNRVFFGRFDTTQTLTEGTDCIVYDKVSIGSESLVTSVRWVMDFLSFQGHGKTGKILPSLPVDPTAEPVGLRFSFSFLDLAVKYETIFVDVDSDERLEYGLSRKAYQFGDSEQPSITAEAVERYEPNASEVNVGIVYGSTNDSFFNITLLSDATDVNFVPNTFSNTITFYRDITNINDVVGFQAEFEGFPFAWTLHNATVDDTYPIPEVDKVVSKGLDGVIFFSKTDIEAQRVGASDVFRLMVTVAIDPSKIDALTAEPSISVRGCWLVRFNTAYLNRLGQSLMVFPSADNKVITCFDFVEPSREVVVNMLDGSTQTFVANTFTDAYGYEEWGTVIAIGQAETADAEILNDLLRELAEKRLKL